MPEESLLTRTLKLGSKGKDVDGAARAMHRYLGVGSLKAHAAKPESVRRYFGPGKAALTVRARRKAGFATWKPWVDQKFWAFLVKSGAPDALAIDLMNAYRDALPPPKPKLVEPRQGFGSLHRSLWEAYSIARAEPWATDLGTFNGASRLPSGRPSDHAVYPAMAFDIGGFSGGSQNPKALALFHKLRVLPEVEYVLLGRLIGTNDGTRPFYGGGHETHLHISGRR